LQQLHDVLENCYSPRPIVEWVYDVMDWRDLVNPGVPRDFPVKSSRVKQLRGVATKIDDPAKEHMGGTSPLHWWLRKDVNGKVIVQNKFTCDDSQWSAPQYFWNDKAPRPDNREFEAGTSGLLPSDLRVAPRRVMTTTREDQLKASLAAIQWRLKEEEKEQFHRVFHELKQPVRTIHPPPEHNGVFACEQKGDESDSDDFEELSLRPRTMWNSQSEQNRARQRRRENGYSKKLLVINNFISYATNYTADTPEEKQQDFWVRSWPSIKKGVKLLSKCGTHPR
jgi:hypothetical protein